MNILVVDDDPEIRDIFKDCLATKGLSVCEASDGAVGIGALEENKVSAVICDLNMPHFDGMYFLKIAKIKFPKIPIYIFSCSLRYSQKELLEQGATRVIAKPDFFAMIHEILSNDCQSG
jgi:CheY-like chemotaxis protein